MAWCNFCRQKIIWEQINSKWIPCDIGSIDHRKTCIPDPSYIEKRDRILKSSHSPEKIQIGAEEFI
jgi:hypothetical protein